MDCKKEGLTMAQLAENHYGKSRVRVMKIFRNADTHDVREWSVNVHLVGAFDETFLTGDNAGIIATDTMKNTVYSVARNSSATAMEEFAMELAKFLLDRNAQVAGVHVAVEETAWMRLKAHGVKHKSAFMQRGPEHQTCSLRHTRGERPEMVSGVAGLIILKTSQSAFTGFDRDDLTTLPETTDRLMGTEATILWSYGTLPEDFAATRATVLDALLTSFADHDSLSVQHTLYAMAEAALEAAPELTELTLTMPNRHNIPIDFTRFKADFKQDNPNMIFVPTDEPSGHIHARVTR